MKTKTVFRKFPSGEIVALFPEIGEGRGLISSYMHTGQHGAACPSIVSTTKPAKPDEYEPLALELKAIGYEVEPRSKITYKMLQKGRETA